MQHTDTNDAEDDHNTGLPGSPVLPLDQLASDKVTGDESVDGGHCEILSRAERSGEETRGAVGEKNVKS